MNKLLLLFLLSCSILQGQNDPFYLEFKSDEKYEFQFSSIQFASLNKEELIYLRTYTIKDTFGLQGKVLGYDNYLSISDTKGALIKQINIVNDSLTINCLLGTRHLDNILLFGTAFNGSNNYIISCTFDLELNQIGQTITHFESGLRKEIYFPKYNTFGDEKYILLNSIMENDHGIALRFDKNGVQNLIKSSKYFSSIDYAGFTYSPANEKIMLITSVGGFEMRLLTFDMELNFINSKKVYNEPGGINYSFHRFANYIPKGSGHIGFGKAYRATGDSLIASKVISEVDSNLILVNKYYAEVTQESGYADGAPSYTGGLFEGTDGYYTCYELITGPNNPVGSTFLINKYNFDLEPVWNKRFILDDSVKFWNYHAEISEDNRIIISGEGTDYRKVFFEKDFTFGHIIGLDPNGNPSTSKTKKLSSNTMFSIIENPVRNELKMEKLTNDGKKYDIQMLDLNGRILRTAHNWTDYNLNINVSDYTPGTYIYTISEAGRLIYSGKFIKVN